MILFLSKKKLQAKIDAAIARIPKPEPGPDWTPELDAMRDEIEGLRHEHAEQESDQSRRFEERLTQEREGHLSIISGIKGALAEVRALAERTAELGQQLADRVARRSEMPAEQPEELVEVATGEIAPQDVVYRVLGRPEPGYPHGYYPPLGGTEPSLPVVRPMGSRPIGG